MRQAGTLTNQRDAKRFAAWLVTQRIEAHAEEQNGEWAIWVRDEDQLKQAREALAHWASSLSGQVWRVPPPMFVHFSIWHLAFNMLCLWDFGGQVEDRRGSRQMLLLVLALAIAANIGQALEATIQNRIEYSGGMS